MLKLSKQAPKKQQQSISKSKMNKMKSTKVVAKRKMTTTAKPTPTATQSTTTTAAATTTTTATTKTPTTSSTSSTPTSTIPSFATTNLRRSHAEDRGGQLQFDTPNQYKRVTNILSKGSTPSLLSHTPIIDFESVPHPELSRRGFDARLVHEGTLSETLLKQQLPSSKVFVLPVSSKIGRKYVDDIRSGKVIEQMYKEITKTENLQEVYTPEHTYVHWFRLHERNQRDFLKRLGLIETKLTQRFGSTYYLHVSKAIRKYRKRFTILRSPFVHKKAQDTYEYNHHEFLCKVSYAFAITDPEINDFIYSQLKSQVISSGGGISFGWDVKLTKPRVRTQRYTPLSSPILNREGANPDITQIKYANYVGQQELLRQHCEANGLDYESYAGDGNLFPIRDEMTRFRDKKMRYIADGMTPSEAEQKLFEESGMSELSELTHSESEEAALGILKL